MNRSFITLNITLQSDRCLLLLLSAIFYKVLDTQSLESARALIEGAQNILITAHKSPDGDAIGSSLALYHYLKAKGITAKVMMPNDYPDFLKWIPGNDVVMIYQDNLQAGDDVIDQADLVFSLDYNVLYRTGGMAKQLEASDAKFIMIDHHQQPADYPAVTFSDTASL
jgi:phosphoesterase RecJ-like protein